MGELLFGIDMQQVIGDSIPPSDMPSFTLIQVSSDPTTLGNDQIDEASYTCHGAITDYCLDDLAKNPLIQAGDKMAVIIGKPLNDLGVEPQLNWVLVDQVGRRYTIMKADSTTFRASWILQCRG